MVDMESSTVWNALEVYAVVSSHDGMITSYNTTSPAATQFVFVNPTTSASRVAILVTYLVGPPTTMMTSS